MTVPRAHIETVVTDGQEHGVKLGVFLTNNKTRRAKLTADKLAVLAALGLEWAAQEPGPGEGRWSGRRRRGRPARPPHHPDPARHQPLSAARFDS
ncbi:hypothetical protein [Streptomyces sp. NPDC056844]|uniref:hypothetical protein n=1 Tax=unclassified Streptomyces TaxID=2593676 RepID=UPI0036AF5C65